MAIVDCGHRRRDLLRSRKMDDESARPGPTTPRRSLRSSRAKNGERDSRLRTSVTLKRREDSHYDRELGSHSDDSKDSDTTDSDDSNDDDDDDDDDGGSNDLPTMATAPPSALAPTQTPSGPLEIRDAKSPGVSPGVLAGAAFAGAFGLAMLAVAIFIGIGRHRARQRQGQTSNGGDGIAMAYVGGRPFKSIASDSTQE